MAKWQNCLICAILLCYTIIQDYLFSTFNNELTSTLLLSPFAYGNLASIYWYTLALSLIPVGMLYDRSPPKQLLILASLTCTLSALIFCISISYYSCVINRMLAALAYALAITGGMRIIQDNYKTTVSLITGAFLAIGNTGGIVACGPYIILKESYSWNTVASLNGLIGVLITAIIVFGLKTSKNTELKTNITFQEQIKETFTGLKLAFYNPNNWACGLYAGLFTITDSIFASLWGIVYLTQKYSFSETQAGVIISFYVIGIIIGGPLIGWLVDVRKNIKPITTTASIACAVIFLSMSYSSMLDMKTIASLLILIGILDCSMLLIFTSVKNYAPPKYVATSFAFATLIMNLCSAFFQPIFGFILEKQWTGAKNNGIPIYTSQELDVAMLMIPIAFILSLLLIYFIKGNLKEREII